MRKKLLFEDILNYNKWVSGIASRELASQRVTLKDLFNKTYTNQHPNDAAAEPVLPNPLQNVVSQIGDLYINAVNAKKMFIDSLQNPVIQKNKEAQEGIKNIVSKLEAIVSIIKGIVEQSNKPVDKKKK